MLPDRLSRILTLVCALMLFVGGLSPAAAQFLPMPGQSTPNAQFPPAPGQARSNPFPPPPGQAPRQSSPFPPPPGQVSAPAAGANPFPPAPGGPSRQAGPFSPAGGQNVCASFPAIREDAQKSAAAIQAASKRKASREEVCPLFKNFAAKEAKLIKFLVTNQSQCRVPAQAIKVAKENHAKTLQVRNQICAAAPAPPGPSLSDALGAPIVADDLSAQKNPGRSTFDTLTGNVLSR